jgi:hypothetical protein
MTTEDFVGVKQGDVLYFSRLDKNGNLKTFEVDIGFCLVIDNAFGISGREKWTVGSVNNLYEHEGFVLLESGLYTILEKDPIQAMINYMGYIGA